MSAEVIVLETKLAIKGRKKEGKKRKKKSLKKLPRKAVHALDFRKQMFL